MASRSSGGSVRIGPLSIFTLVIILCLAVLGVLAFTTAEASYSVVEKQAEYTSDSYDLEERAWSLIAEIDATAAKTVRNGGDMNSVLSAIQKSLPSDASLKANEVSIEFKAPSGKKLDVTLVVSENYDLSIKSWKQGTDRTETPSTSDKIWSGSR